MPYDPSSSSDSAVATSTPKSEIVVTAARGQAKQVHESSPRVVSLGSSPKSLESVVLSLHTAAKRSVCNTGTPISSNHQDEISVEVVTFDGQIETLITSSNNAPVQTGSEDFRSQGLLNDEPYPVFLPNISESEADCTESSTCEVTNQKIIIPPCHVSSLPQNCLEEENDLNATLSGSSDAEIQGHLTDEYSATCSLSNGVSDPDSTGKCISEKHCDNEEERGIIVKENIKSSSTGDSAFFDFLLTQGSEFNPSMKSQIVKLIKSEFGREMASFNAEIFKTEMEKRQLEAEIRNSKQTLQQKEEEKLRLFAEIENLQKSIEQATEKHGILVQKCERLKQESSAVKRKISSCEVVERELGGSPAKSSKLVE